MGSASRAFMLCVPLDAGGMIDEAVLARRPTLATVRRFWPNEADQWGHVVRTKVGWAFSYAPGEVDDEDLIHLENDPLRVGGHVSVREPDGRIYPFRIVSVQPDGIAD